MDKDIRLRDNGNSSVKMQSSRAEVKLRRWQRISKGGISLENEQVSQGQD